MVNTMGARRFSVAGLSAAHLIRIGTSSPETMFLTNDCGFYGISEMEKKIWEMKTSRIESAIMRHGLL